MSPRAKKSGRRASTSDPKDKLTEHLSFHPNPPEYLEALQQHSDDMYPEDVDPEDMNTDDDLKSDLDSEDLAHLDWWRDGAEILTKSMQNCRASGAFRPKSFFSALEEYDLSLAGLLDQRGTDVSIVKQVVDNNEYEARENLVRAYEAFWAHAITEYLGRQAEKLEAKVHAGTLSLKDESAFVRLGKQIHYASGAIPTPDMDMDYNDWIIFAPTPIKEPVQDTLDRAQEMYEVYRRQVYLDPNTKEDLKLWYLVWMNLRKILSKIKDFDWSAPSGLFPVEKAFSNDLVHRRWFDWCWQQLEISAFQEVEDLVAEYCKFIDEHREKGDLPKRFLRPQDGSKTLNQETLSMLMQFDTTLEQKEDPRVGEALHKAVIRLNYLTGGPALLRRLGRTVVFYLADKALTADFKELQEENEDLLGQMLPATPLSPVWLPIPEAEEAEDEEDEEDEVDEEDEEEEEEDGAVFSERSSAHRFLSSPHMSSYVLPSIDPNETNADSLEGQISEDESLLDETPEVVGEQSPEEDEDEMDHSPTTEGLSLDRADDVSSFSYIPRGRNMLSAFDYVHCPIPENRAYEVANSRLISRDLREPGHVSEGLRVEDVINLPPLHCRNPKSWTTWKQRIPLGPYEIFRLLGSTFLDRVRGIRPQPQQRPLQPPSITSRHECRHDKHKRKSATVNDPNARVTKSKANQKLRLRGGGPRYVPDPDESPTPKKKSAMSKIIKVKKEQTEIQTVPPPRQPGSQRPGSTIHDPVTISSGSESEDQTSDAGLPANHGRAPLGEITKDVLESIENDEDALGEQGINRVSPNVDIAPGRCHPCPWYEGQYHHSCSKGCPGETPIARFSNLIPDEVDKPSIFTGSLWEVFDSGYFLQDFCPSLEDFVEQYAWSAGGRIFRNFMFSNGAQMRLSRDLGGRVEILVWAMPRWQWGPSLHHWGLDPEIRFLDKMPQGLKRIDVQQLHDAEPHEIEHPPALITVDTLVSPAWTTGTTFELYFERHGGERVLLTVSLERTIHDFPRERLVVGRIGGNGPQVAENFKHSATVPGREPFEVEDTAAHHPGGNVQPHAATAQQPAAAFQPSAMRPGSHIRDYDAPGFDGGDDADKNAYPGYQDLINFQEKLRQLKANRKSRAEHAQQKQDKTVNDHAANKQAVNDQAAGGAAKNVDREQMANLEAGTKDNTRKSIERDMQQVKDVIRRLQQRSSGAKDVTDDDNYVPVPAPPPNLGHGHSQGNGHGQSPTVAQATAILQEPTAPQGPRTPQEPTAPQGPTTPGAQIIPQAYASPQVRRTPKAPTPEALETPLVLETPQAPTNGQGSGKSAKQQQSKTNKQTSKNSKSQSGGNSPQNAGVQSIQQQPTHQDGKSPKQDSINDNQPKQPEKKLVKKDEAKKDEAKHGKDTKKPGKKPPTKIQKDPDTPAPKKMTTRLQAKKAAEDAKKATKDKDNDKDNKDKAKGKGKNKRPANDDPEESDDQLAPSPAGKRGGKAGGRGGRANKKRRGGK